MSAVEKQLLAVGKKLCPLPSILCLPSVMHWNPGAQLRLGRDPLLNSGPDAQPRAACRPWPKRCARIGSINPIKLSSQIN
eukprot:758828-Lingulodinium_polyedra.AAC.1